MSDRRKVKARVGTINLRGIPVDLRCDFKAVLDRKGKTMTGVFLTFMRKVVKKGEIPGDI